jgi:hypothetical protein
MAMRRAIERAQRAHDVDVGRRAVCGEASAHELVLREARQLLLDEMRQLQILEQQVEEFIARQLEDEVVFPFAGVARLAAAIALPAGGARHPVAADELAVTRVDALAPSALRDGKRRLGDVPGRDLDPLALVHLRDAATRSGVGDRLLELRPKALQEALSVDDTLFLASSLGR